MNEVTSLETLKKYATGQRVELPPFGEGMPFVAMLRKPSMMSLAKNGKIPNSLLSSAAKMFPDASEGNVSDAKVATQFYDTLVAVADASLVNPTYSQIKEAGINLTDAQLIAIFEFSQAEVKSLDSFRKE